MSELLYTCSKSTSVPENPLTPSILKILAGFVYPDPANMPLYISSFHLFHQPGSIPAGWQ